MDPVRTDPIPSPASSKEETLWSGSPSHARYFGTYVLCALFCWLIVPIFIALWRWIQVRAIRYEVTTQRLRLTTGLFSKRTEEVELYRVQDTTLEEPFKLRLWGAGNILLDTHDISTPRVVLEAVPQARVVREHLRQAIEAVRERKRVRTVEND